MAGPVVVGIGTPRVRHIIDKITLRTLCDRDTFAMQEPPRAEEGKYPLCEDCAAILAGTPKKTGRIRVAPAAERTLDGILFDSRAEATRYAELKMLLKAGHIQKLELQPRFPLVPAQEGERGLSYVADFAYEEAGHRIVEDVKGMRTDVYKLKRKLFRAMYPEVDFREVEA
jgi:hypothetical protein